MTAQAPRVAASQVLSGEPASAGRRWLAWISLGAFVLFVIDSVLVLNAIPQTSVDLPLERAVQAFPWGPLTYLMTLTNATGGWPQYLLGAVAVVTMFIYERRAGMLLAIGAVASFLDSILKVSVQRHRPTADLVQVLSPNNGYSYASGHAVFFTWLFFMLAASLSPRLGPRGRIATWSVAAAVVFVACLGRVWAGAHWPSDVLGGFLLGISWAAFVLWLPERWLPSPSWRRRRTRARARVNSWLAWRNRLS
jgi:membrane-associated phospholipid phosphatase